MHIYIEAGFLAHLYRPTPKVFVGGEALPDGLELLASGPLADMLDVWLVHRRHSTDALELWPQHGQVSLSRNTNQPSLVCVEQPPAAMCLLVAPSPHAAVELQHLLEWWQAHSAGELPPLLTSKTTQTRPLDDLAIIVVAALLQASRAEVQQAVCEHVSLAAQLSVLRQECEEARVAMHAMEQQLCALQARPQLYWCLSPDNRSYMPHAPTVVTQRLPISSAGLLGFDLHAAHLYEMSQDVLLVSLDACDVGERLGAWRIPASALGRGWLRCWLPRALVRLHNDVVVRVAWAKGGPGAPALSLADVGDWPELVAVDQQGGSLEGALAIALWAAPPGLAIEPTATFCAPLTDHTIEYTLSQPELTTLRTLTPHAEMAYLQFLSPAGFQLHPLRNQVAAAVLRGGCISGVDRVTATITVNNRLCQTPVDFALLVTHDEYAGYALLTEAGDDSRVLAFSGWHEFPPDCQPHPLILELPEPLVTPAHLVFATRTPGEASIDYAWAQWLEVRLRFRDQYGPWGLAVSESASHSNMSCGQHVMTIEHLDSAVGQATPLAGRQVIVSRQTAQLTEATRCQEMLATVTNPRSDRVLEWCRAKLLPFGTWRGGIVRNRVRRLFRALQSPRP